MSENEEELKEEVKETPEVIEKSKGPVFGGVGLGLGLTADALIVVYTFMTKNLYLDGISNLSLLGGIASVSIFIWMLVIAAFVLGVIALRRRDPHDSAAGPFVTIVVFIALNIVLSLW